VSRPSAAENRYFDQLGAHLRDNYVPCPIYPNLRAVERSHARGVAMWETGAGMKAHPFLRGRVIEEGAPRMRRRPRRETGHGVNHAKLVRDQWRPLEITPGPWMKVGMSPKHIRPY
jgi:hypothetical protein